MVNLLEVVGQVFDFTIESLRQEHLDTAAQRIATSSFEVLVQGWIPPNAIKGLIP